MHRFILLFCTLCIVRCPAQDVESLNKKVEQDFIVATIPKSGTHLFLKLLYLISQKENKTLPAIFNAQDQRSEPVYPRGKILRDTKHWFDNDCYLIIHMNFLQYYERLPNCIDPLFFCLIRDLRDVVVSATFWQSAYIDKMVGHKTTFDEKLLHIIKGDYPFPIWNFSFHASEAVKWIDHLSTHFFRFEDLIGENGGGSDEDLENSILRIASCLEISLTDEEINHVKESLWGEAENNPRMINGTFREGKIGSWRKHFKKKHVKAFKEYLGQYLIDLGYEKDNNWD